MPITYVAAGAASTGNNAGLTPALPAGVAAGDVVVAAFAARGNGTIGIPSGWTAFPSSPYRNATTAVIQFALAWRVWQTGVTAPAFTYSGGASGNDTLAQCAAFRGVDNTSPVVGANAASANAAALNIGPIAALASPGANSAILVIGAKGDDFTSAATLTGDGLTWAEIGEPKSTLGTDAGFVWDYAIASGTPTLTAKTFTITGGTSVVGVGTMAALREATLPPAPPSGLLGSADDFGDGVRAAQWAAPLANAVTVAETGGQLVITPATSAAGSVYNGYIGQAANATGRESFVRIVQAATNASTNTILQWDAAGTILWWMVEGGQLYAQQIGAATPTIAGPIAFIALVVCSDTGGYVAGLLLGLAGLVTLPAAPALGSVQP